LDRVSDDKAQVQQELHNLKQTEQSSARTIAALQNKIVLLQREIEIQKQNLAQVSTLFSE